MENDTYLYSMFRGLDDLSYLSNIELKKPFNPIHRKNKPNRKNMNLVSRRTKSKHNRK